MKFIKRKNLLDGEELLYIPRLHWLFLLKPVLKSLPFFIVLFLLWIFSAPITSSRELPGFKFDIPLINNVFKYIFYVSILAVVIMLVCRIFQYLTTEFGVTSKRLLIKKGVFKVFVSDIPTDRIESIYCFQNFWERIFHCGTIFISGVGGMVPTFFMISRPYALRRKIVEVMERNKAITVVHGNLPRAPQVENPKVKEYPLYLFGTFVRVVS